MPRGDEPADRTSVVDLRTHQHVQEDHEAERRNRSESVGDASDSKAPPAGVPKDEPERDCDNHGDEHRYNRVHHMLTQRDEQTVRSRPMRRGRQPTGHEPDAG